MLFSSPVPPDMSLFVFVTVCETSGNGNSPPVSSERNGEIKKSDTLRIIQSLGENKK